jgi:hypothetical protein
VSQGLLTLWFFIWGFGFIYFVEMVFAWIVCMQAYLVRCWLQDWNSSCLGEASRIVLKIDFLSSQLFCQSILTDQSMIMNSKLPGLCHELLGLWMIRLVYIICYCIFYCNLSFFSFDLYFYWFWNVFLDYFCLVVSPSLGTCNDGKLLKSLMTPWCEDNLRSAKA